MKTDEEYLKSYGRCPFCDSPETEGGNSLFDADYCHVVVSCGGCGEQWFDLYRLVGFERKGGE